MRSAKGASEETLRRGELGPSPPLSGRTPSLRATHLSHLSLLFLQGSQFIAFLARFGGGRESDPAPSMGSCVPFVPGERPRTCFNLGAEGEVVVGALGAER